MTRPSMLQCSLFLVRFVNRIWCISCITIMVPKWWKHHATMRLVMFSVGPTMHRTHLFGTIWMMDKHHILVGFWIYYVMIGLWMGIWMRIQTVHSDSRTSSDYHIKRLVSKKGENWLYCMEGTIIKLNGVYIYIMWYIYPLRITPQWQNELNDLLNLFNIAYGIFKYFQKMECHSYAIVVQTREIWYFHYFASNPLPYRLCKATG